MDPSRFLIASKDGAMRRQRDIYEKEINFEKDIRRGGILMSEVKPFYQSKAKMGAIALGLTALVRAYITGAFTIDTLNELLIALSIFGIRDAINR